MAAEEHFEIEIHDEEASYVETVADFQALIAKKLAGRPEQRTPSALFEELADLIAVECSVERGRILPSAKIVKDLGIN